MEIDQSHGCSNLKHLLYPSLVFVLVETHLTAYMRHLGILFEIYQKMGCQLVLYTFFYLPVLSHRCANASFRSLQRSCLCAISFQFFRPNNFLKKKKLLLFYHIIFNLEVNENESEEYPLHTKERYGYKRECVKRHRVRLSCYTCLESTQ